MSFPFLFRPPRNSALLFPIIEEIAKGGSGTTQVTSYAVPLPTCDADDLLIMLVALGGTNSCSPTAPTGWYTIYAFGSGTPGGSLRAVRAFARRATGAEGSTVTVTSTAATRFVTQVFRISNCVPAPICTAGLVIGTSSSPNPGSNTHWGAEVNALCIAAAADLLTNLTPPSLPSTYSDAELAANDNTTPVVRFTTGRKFLTATSEDPGTFGLASSSSWGAYHFSVQRAYPGAYPAVAASNKSTEGSVSSHNAALPASISAGDLLILSCALYANGSRTFTTPSGWTELATGASGTSSDFAIRRTSVFYKVASGSEGSSVAVTASGAGQWACTSARITGYQGTPEAIAVMGVVNANTYPSALTPSWGLDRALWLTNVVASSSVQWDTGGYVELQYAAQSTVAGNWLGSLERYAATERPQNGSRGLQTYGANITIGIRAA